MGEKGYNKLANKCKQVTLCHFKKSAQPLADWECLRVLMFVVLFGEQMITPLFTLCHLRTIHINIPNSRSTMVYLTTAVCSLIGAEQTDP